MICQALPRLYSHSALVAVFGQQLFRHMDSTQVMHFKLRKVHRAIVMRLFSPYHRSWLHADAERCEG